MHGFYFCILVLFQVQFIDANYRRGQMQWSDCTNPASPLRVTHLNMEPTPVRLPGALNYSMRGYSTRTIGSSRLLLDIERLGSWVNVPIPCLFNIGSCTYPDLCTMLDQMIDENWLGATRLVGQDIKAMVIRHGLDPGMCPQPPIQIDIRQNRLRLPEMPSALYWFAEGVYHANVRVIENSNDEEILCVDINLHVKRREECSGWFSCIFNG